MNARRVTLTVAVSLCALVGMLALGGVAAWAAAPTVGEESFSKVGSTTVTVSAQIDAEGSPTTYRIEYGTSEKYGSSTPEASIGAPEGAVGVSTQLNELQPGVEYHFHFVATNAVKETAEGKDVTFTTGASAGASSSALPDGRAYELVSPPHDQSNREVYVPYGVTLFNEQDLVSVEAFRASADGGAVVYGGDPPSSGGSGSQGKGTGDQWLARRTPLGWEASDVQPVGGIITTEYEAFSSDLSTGIVKSFNNPATGHFPLTEDAPVHCSVLYSHTAGGFHAIFTTTETPGFCGEKPISAGGNEGTAAVPKYSHLLFETEAALTQPAVAAESEEEYNLYESVGGQLRLVNILPEGKADPNATFGGPSAGESSEERQPDFSNAISADGSRIFWTDRRTGDLYVRENGTITVPVSAGLGAARFWTATPDGRYVFYTEGEKLWRFDVEGETREELAGTGAAVQGVIGVNETGEDGAYVYFVAGGALAPGTEPRKCATAASFSFEAERQRLEAEGKSKEEAFQITLKLYEKLPAETKEEEAGHLPAGRGCNLYIMHAGGPPMFIAALSAADNAFLRVELNLYGDWQGKLGSRTAELTPDGRHLTFMSRLQLTGYDNVVHQENGNIEAAPETFVYDTGSGRIFCVSCNPTGEPPSQPGSFGGSSPAVGSYEPIGWNVNAYMHRWINEAGTEVFFSTAQALVPQDTNGRGDVYEWEQEGSGNSSCPEETPRRTNGGCLFLLSGGASADASALVDASANGDDVFFVTRGQLAPQDRNENMDIYDARVAGGFPEVSLSCTGTGCQGVPPAPPIFATPSSATFNGVGNFEAPAKATVKPKPRAKPKRCKRGFVKKHGRCVKNKAGKASKRSKRGKK